MRAKVAQCGTLAGYAKHQRLKEPFCDPCREVRNAYLRSYKAYRKRKTLWVALPWSVVERLLEHAPESLRQTTSYQMHRLPKPGEDTPPQSG